MRYEETLKNLGGSAEEMKRMLKFLVEGGIATARERWIKCNIDKTWRQLMDEEMVNEEIAKINTAADLLASYVDKLTDIAVAIRDSGENENPERIALLEKTINESYEAAKQVDKHTYRALDLHKLHTGGEPHHREVITYWETNVDALVKLLEIDFSIIHPIDPEEDPKW